MGKPGVMFYFEVRPCLSELDDGEQAELFRAILDYGQFREVQPLSKNLRLIWGFIQQRLDADDARYDQTIIQSRYANYSKEAKRRQLPRLTFQQWQEVNGLAERDYALSVPGDGIPERMELHMAENEAEPVGTVRYPTEPDGTVRYPMEPDGTVRYPSDVFGTQLQTQLQHQHQTQLQIQNQLQNQSQIQNQKQNQMQAQKQNQMQAQQQNQTQIPPQENFGPSATPPAFSPPDRETVLGYCREQGLQMDVDSFLDYYTANGWTVGRSPMKNWQAAVRRWCRKEEADGKTVVPSSWNVGVTI